MDLLAAGDNAVPSVCVQPEELSDEGLRALILSAKACWYR